jgi:hypothetical protein
MTEREHRFIDFVQCHVSIIKQHDIKIYYVGTYQHNNFGRDYVRIAAYSLDKNITVPEHKLYVLREDTYYSYTVRDKNYDYHSLEKVKRYAVQYEQSYADINSNVELLVCVLKATFPELVIVNRCMNYKLPLDFKYAKEASYDLEWIEESKKQIPYVNVLTKNPYFSAKWIDYCDDETYEKIRSDWSYVNAAIMGAAISKIFE